MIKIEYKLEGVEFLTGIKRFRANFLAALIQAGQNAGRLLVLKTHEGVLAGSLELAPISANWAAEKGHSGVYWDTKQLIDAMTSKLLMANLSLVSGQVGWDGGSVHSHKTHKRRFTLPSNGKSKMFSRGIPNWYLARIHAEGSYLKNKAPASRLPKHKRLSESVGKARNPFIVIAKRHAKDVGEKFFEAFLRAWGVGK